MAAPLHYASDAPDRDEVDAMPGELALEFGTAWCPRCQGAQSALQPELAARPGLRHLRIEDGPGRPLGRSFRVKLWPTLIVLRDGVEVARVVRPTSREDVAEGLAALDRT